MGYRGLPCGGFKATRGTNGKRYIFPLGRMPMGANCSSGLWQPRETALLAILPLQKSLFTAPLTLGCQRIVSMPTGIGMDMGMPGFLQTAVKIYLLLVMLAGPEIVMIFLLQ